MTLDERAALSLVAPVLVDMFSDLNCSTHPEDDPLTFDDLLDIAREFEFTHTITHIWPCEEDLSPRSETPILDDILAAILPTPNPEECPLPLPSTTLDPVLMDLRRPLSMFPVPDANASIIRDPMPLDDDRIQVEVGPPITSTLCGWAPPDGSQFLDLDEGFMLPQSVSDIWTPPWLVTFLAPPSMQPASSINQPSPMVPPIGDVQPHAWATELHALPATTIDETDVHRKKSVPLVPLPLQTRVILEPARALSDLQSNSSVPGQATMIPHAKTPKSRPGLHSTPASGGTPVARYAKAPRGGIPPHIARTVTKANILRVEKERKMMQDAFSNATTGQGKKPSVLRKSKAERATSNTIDDGDCAKPSVWRENDEKGGRMTKRVRV